MKQNVDKVMNEYFPEDQIIRNVLCVFPTNFTRNNHFTVIYLFIYIKSPGGACPQTPPNMQHKVTPLAAGVTAVMRGDVMYARTQCTAQTGTYLE
jgi:hypothetical protein